ncbi:MAG: hypothetical protein VW270_05780 [Candidatus Poseidoniales archaeon]|jgi:hypothetical protein
MTEWYTKLVSVMLNENNEHVYLYEDGSVEIKQLMLSNEEPEDEGKD